MRWGGEPGIVSHPPFPEGSRADSERGGKVPSASFHWTLTVREAGAGLPPLHGLRERLMFYLGARVKETPKHFVRLEMNPDFELSHALVMSRWLQSVPSVPRTDAGGSVLAASQSLHTQ